MPPSIAEARVEFTGQRVTVDRAKLRAQGMIQPDGPVTTLLEEFRLVKRQLLLAARAGHGSAAQRVLVCSPLPGEGKTFCAVNLALAMAAERDSEVVLVDAITPTHLVRYVGAAGDWHPLHHDRAMAQALGYPDVFAPGMLTMALTAEALTAQLGGPGRGALVRLASRFRAQVWPGDSLYAAVTEHGDGTLSARTRNQFDEVVVETTAALA